MKGVDRTSQYEPAHLSKQIQKRVYYDPQEEGMYVRADIALVLSVCIFF